MRALRSGWAVGVLGGFWVLAQCGCGSRSELSVLQGDGQMRPSPGLAPEGLPTGNGAVRDGEERRGGRGGAAGLPSVDSTAMAGRGSLPSRPPDMRDRSERPPESGGLVADSFEEVSDWPEEPDPRRQPVFAPEAPPPRVSLGAPPRCEGTALSIDSTLRALVQAAGQRPERAASLRYVSLGNQLHTGCVGRSRGAQADWARLAVGALVNSLSLKPQLVLPTPLDAGMLLLELDLADYGWDTPVTVAGVEYRDAWAALAAHSRQGQRFVGPQADALVALTGAEVPLLLANDLVTTATLPSLYYAILRLPDTLAELMAELELPEVVDYADGNWALAGTSRSVVSRQERRLVRARVTGRTQVWWQALQYSPDTQYAGSLLDPMAIQADASVALFALPNGRPAFFAADAAGRRADVAEFLFDTSANDFAARPPVSCLGCHSGGANVVFSAQDEVRELYASGFASGTPLEAEVLAAYPPARQMAGWVREDNEVFFRASQQLGIPEGEDPVSHSVLYRNQDIAAADVASELFLDEPGLRQRLDQMPEAVRVAAGAEVVERLLFDQVYLPALCAATNDSLNRPEECL